MAWLFSGKLNTENWDGLDKKVFSKSPGVKASVPELALLESTRPFKRWDSVRGAWVPEGILSMMLVSSSPFIFLFLLPGLCYNWIYSVAHFCNYLLFFHKP